jgi:hypothetical protein
MKDKKLQIFVSSTFTDLKEERQAAVEAILSSGHIPAGMELFSAGDESQMDVIERWIDESDVYLLILGGRYGSIDKKTGKSYIQLEYEFAIEKKKPLFAVVISEKALEKRVKSIGSSVIEQENAKELKEFRSKVLSNLVKFWEDKKDIKIAIHETISEFSYRKELIGWIRGDNSVNTGLLAEEIAKLTNENSELRIQLSRSNIESNFSYAGLSYYELERLLKSEIMSMNSVELTLFDYIIENGNKFSMNYHSSREGEYNILEKLVIFKLMKTDSHRYFFIFSDVGHSFYLKALIMSKK